ncbi:Activator of Hsp90 ATPase like protein [Desulfocurvibacter africanus PCS]|uniref:Activator of Hsp90 ATPase like protein n=1 Tax=Desulfocurvibacter africanus PCS TaxID=1262666 RepID=M5PZI9_DESAF|nr:SRPBCC domain-containing protein [Desulfocurvibacter africanus]EMG35896.1 Activator of Hsp90 ATPase like protein [Desulfocurvibacter africanus PCS]
MSKELMKKTVTINAPRDKVWDVLLRDEYTRVWYAEFSEGTHAEGDWNVGGRIAFVDNSGMGLVGKLVAKKPPELLSIEHQAVIMNGKEDQSSPETMKWRGCKENYTLSQEDGKTTLTIEQELPEEYLDSVPKSWDNAVRKIKELSESTT